MSEFFTEVDEAMKQERLERLWKEYGGMFLSFLAMIVLVTAVNAGYQSWIKHRNAKQTTLYLDALDKKNLSVDDLLALIPDVSTGMKTVINMRAAGLALEQNNTQKALEIYNSISNDEAQKEENPILASMASYMAINLDDKMEPNDKIVRYEMIAKEETNPWRYNAMMDIALLEATKNNNYKKAHLYLEQIKKDNSKAAQGLKQKAMSLDVLYKAQQNDNKK